MTNKLNLIAGVATLALVFGAAPGFAQNGSTTHDPNGSVPSEPNHTGTRNVTGTSSADQAFAMKAAQGGMAEVKLGQLAEQRGSNPMVKEFGRRMVQDHSKANQQLMSVASSENIAIPKELDKSDQATYDRLSKLSGDEFDRAYARDMVKDHTKDVSDFQREANDGQNGAIKNFATQTLPTLQSHLNEARKMDSAVNQSASNRTNGTTYPSNNTVPATQR